VYLQLVTLPVLVGLRSQTALTVILLGFDNGRAGRMAAHRRRHTVPGWFSGLPGGCCLDGQPYDGREVDPLSRRNLPEALKLRGPIGGLRAFAGGRRLRDGDASIDQNVEVKFPLDEGTPCPEFERSINLAFDVAFRQARDRA
jgi:hypothetical protein